MVKWFSFEKDNATSRKNSLLGRKDANIEIVDGYRLKKHVDRKRKLDESVVVRSTLSSELVTENINPVFSDGEDDEDEEDATSEDLRNGCIVVEIDDASPQQQAPAFSPSGSPLPILRRLDGPVNVYSPAASTGLLHFGSPTTSTASTPNHDARNDQANEPFVLEVHDEDIVAAFEGTQRQERLIAMEAEHDRPTNAVEAHLAALGRVGIFFKLFVI